MRNILSCDEVPEGVVDNIEEPAAIDPVQPATLASVLALHTESSWKSRRLRFDDALRAISFW